MSEPDGSHGLESGIPAVYDDETVLGELPGCQLPGLRVNISALRQPRLCLSSVAESGNSRGALGLAHAPCVALNRSGWRSNWP